MKIWRSENQRPCSVQEEDARQFQNISYLLLRKRILDGTSNLGRIQKLGNPSFYWRFRDFIGSGKKEDQPSSRIRQWYCRPVRGRFTLWLHRDWSRSCITFLSLKLAQDVSRELVLNGASANLSIVASNKLCLPSRPLASLLPYLPVLSLHTRILSNYFFTTLLHTVPSFPTLFAILTPPLLNYPNLLIYPKCQPNRYGLSFGNRSFRLFYINRLIDRTRIEGLILIATSTLPDAPIRTNAFARQVVSRNEI